MARSLLAGLLLLALVGADGQGCSRGGSNRPPDERQVDPKRERVVLLTVTEATGPYTVMVRAGEVGARRMGDWSTTEAVGPGYEQKLRYTSGLSIEIQMLVKGHPSDSFTCKIVDGSSVNQRQGWGAVVCRIVTQR